MGMYVIFTGNPSNKNAEYKKTGGKWFKRKAGSNDEWVLVDKQYFKFMDKTYNFKKYNNVKPLYRFGIPVAGIVLSYLLFRQFTKK